MKNNKMLPVLLYWNQPLLSEMEVSVPAGTPGEKATVMSLSGQQFLGWYKRSSITSRIRAVKRGCYRMPPLSIKSRDGFGFFYREDTRDDEHYLAVYPRLVPLAELDLIAAELMGDKRDCRNLIPDPIRVV